jgi:hypothetical protein
MNKNAKKMKKTIPARKCIFCGNGNLSGEHLFSEWTQKLIPLTAERWTNHAFTAKSDGDKNVYITPVIRKIEGDIGSKKIRVVCKACNEGWMNTIEERARQVLSSLIMGEPHTLTAEELETIGTWLVLKTIVGEYFDPGFLGINSKVHKWFYENRTIPDHFRLLIAHYTGTEHPRLYRHSNFNLRFADDLPYSTSWEPTHWGQCSTFIIGQILLQSISFDPCPNFVVVQNYEYGVAVRYALHQFFPSKGKVEFPTTPSVGDDQVSAVYRELFHEVSKLFLALEQALCNRTKPP